MPLFYCTTFLTFWPAHMTVNAERIHTNSPHFSYRQRNYITSRLARVPNYENFRAARVMGFWLHGFMRGLIRRCRLHWPLCVCPSCFGLGIHFFGGLSLFLGIRGWGTFWQGVSISWHRTALWRNFIADVEKWRLEFYSILNSHALRTGGNAWHVVWRTVAHEMANNDDSILRRSISRH